MNFMVVGMRFSNLLAVVLFFLSMSSFAAIDVYQFSTDLERIRFESLTSELRCPKCQNQSIADSDAPIAKDMKDAVYAMIIEGRSDYEIKDYLVARYGEFVLYRPEQTGVNLLLWYGPVGLLILAIAGAIIVVRRRSLISEEAS